MDAFGSLELGWSQGYDGSKASYISHKVICFKCGNSVKFVDDGGHENVYATHGEGLGPLAVNGISRVFAYADVGLDPTIHVIQYPTFHMISELKGGAKLEYIDLVFSSSDHVASISGVPEYQLTIWKYTTGDLLCSHDLSHQTPTSLTFNPGNWRQLCLSTKTQFTMWSIEQSNQTFIINKHKMKLPPIDLEDGEEDSGVRESVTRTSTRMSRITVDVPRSCIAGVKGEDADRFEEYEDDKCRVVPVSHCWMPSGDVLVGCEGGQLYKIDGESYKMTMLINPSVQLPTAPSRVSSALSEQSIPDVISEVSAAQGLLVEGSLHCIALHKMGLYVAGEDGVLRVLDVSNDAVKMVSSQSLAVPVSSLCFSPGYNHLALGSTQGCIHVLNTDQPADIRQLVDTRCGTFVAVDVMISKNEKVVTLRENGDLQVWCADSSHLISTLSIGFQTFSLAVSPLCHVAAVGSARGHLFLIDLTDLERPRIIRRTPLHSGPVKHIKFTASGALLLTASDDGNVFVLDGRATEQFTPLGYVEMAGDVESMAVYQDRDEPSKVIVTSNTTGSKDTVANKLIYFDLPDNLAHDIGSKRASLRGDLSQDVINKLSYNFGAPSCGVALSSGNTAFSITQTSNKLYSIMLPDHPPKKEASKDSYLHPAVEVTGHDLHGGRLLLSPHGSWLASIGRDGRLTMRLTESPERLVCVNAHDFRQGGVQDVAFSADCQQMYTVGLDGTLCCYKWKFTTHGESRLRSAVDFAVSRLDSLSLDRVTQDKFMKDLSEWMPSDLQSRPVSASEKAEKEKLEKESEIEKAISSGVMYSTPEPSASANTTWLEARKLEALKEEDNKYSSVKTQLRTEIRDMRKQLQAMMEENEVVAEVERLDHYEFDLDMEEQHRLQAEGDSEVNRIREEKEFENLAKLYLTELIKKECWDEMEVKGRGILSFNSILEVANYPMKARKREELEKLEAVTLQRQIEMADAQARKEMAGTPRKQRVTEDEFLEGDEAEEEGEKPSTTGSLGALYDGDNPHFYSQFELHTREQKITQVTLIEDAIHRIKQKFNQEFDEVFKKKEQEMAKIAEKNKRMVKILGDLGLPLDVFEPSLGPTERPEMLLTVADDEVKVEKFLTAEQRRRMEQQQLLEEERRLREKGDNWRDRGLDMMMGGVLEVKKEDELKKDIPVPAFMVNKTEAEWSEEERRVVAEYEARVKELNEEREKYRKQLEMELKKLQTQVEESTQAFDDLLSRLYMRKVKTEMVIYQEELKILRIRHSLLLEEELTNREVELTDLLQFKKELKGLAEESVNESRKNVDAFRNEYDILVAEDKVMDKAFRREFHDVSGVMQDQLYKLFRRRPRGNKARASITPTFDTSSGNPFADRPSTARQQQVANSALESALADLDREANKPEMVEGPVWERLCAYRRHKVESENLVKQSALVLAEMQDFLDHRQEQDDKLKYEIEELAEQAERLKTDRLRFTCNLEVQLVLKQGQVEVEPGPFIPDYTHSLLIHRAVIEDLNGKIRQLGEGKIASMVESKDFRKGIIQLQWEHKKMTMEMEDLRNQMRDIQSMKVTREIQCYLSEADYDGKKAQQLQTLEQTILMQKKHHEKNVRDKKVVLRDLRGTVREKEEENAALSRELEELNVSVNERRHIHQVNAEKTGDPGRDQRYQEIIQRRKLVDLAKAQAQEVAILRAEVERLRMRTFPALVQVEH